MDTYTLGQILNGRRPLICVRTTDTINTALQIMLTSRVAQLPVLAENDSLQGIISQQNLLRMYYYTDGQAKLLQLPVSHCQESAITLDVSADLLAAIDQLRARGAYAVVVTDAGQPIGILTGRDMSHFFKAIFEGLLLVEQIEVTLRECISLAFPTPEAQAQAILAATRPGRPNKPAVPQRLADLSLTRMLGLIVAVANWPVFDPLLGPLEIFKPLMERVRLVRNEIAHFRGQTDALELDTLRQTTNWLAHRRATHSPISSASASLLMPSVQLHPLTEILAQRQPALCITEGASIREVIQLMVEHRYAQIPVIDAVGRLTGIITEPTILSLYYFTRGEAPLLDLPLHHVIGPAAALAAEDTFFGAVDILTSPGIAAVVVTRQQQPVGILTGKDITHIFRSLCEGIILVERAERTLRDYVDRAYPSEDQLNAATIATFGADPANPQYAQRNPHTLSFGDEIQLITDQDNWPHFEPLLGPKVVFQTLMDQVRQVRNKLLHFKGQLDPLEREVLVRANQWLQQRPLPTPGPA
jgi:CBS domain-containing protein